MSRNEVLESFFGEYFHQDWDILGEDWQQVADQFIAETSAEETQLVCRELKKLAKTLPFDEEAASQHLTNLGSFYFYRDEELTAKQWVQNLASFLSSKS